MPSPIPRVLVDWDVLVVDDEPDSLDVASRLIKLAGAKVVTAQNGRQALDKLKTFRPKFILCDLSMPEMDGWEMLHHLKQDRTMEEIPVIALTAHTMQGDRERAIAAGFHNHISKPLDPTKFMTHLVKLLFDVPELAALLKRTEGV
jgi:two-component system, cell cycle response regulator DivK